jgi:outer membrane protein assembly factor BamE (lipoprotein component of BamABCDE complex)
MEKLWKGLVVIAILAGCVGATSAQVAAARWTNKDNWRQRLKVGMSPVAVKNILGEPAYEEYGQSIVLFYYQTSPIVNITHPDPVNASDANSPKEYLGINGMVVFSLKGTAIVKAWDEPAWDEIASLLPGERSARKPPLPTRKLELWEADKNWRRLSAGMSQKVVEHILGKPMAERENAFATQTTNSQYVEWEYGTGNAKGSVKFNGPKDSPKGALKCYEWKEPFWPTVEATFHPDPNGGKASQKQGRK